jgi:hypothetical protein
MSEHSNNPEYDRLKGNPEAVIAATDRVKNDGTYLEAMKHWSGDRIAEEYFAAVEEIVDARGRNSIGRLAIRLAILQSFVDLEVEELTMGELRVYWKNQVPEKWLSHKDASGLHRSHMMNPADVAAMAGFHGPKVKPHPRPPIRIVSYDGVKREPLDDEANKELERLWAPEDTAQESERLAIVKTRLTQSKFRNALLDIWGGCSVTGLSNPDLLVASHIRPWRESDNFQKIDPNNGLLLNPTLDRLFDIGYITFDPNGMIRISDRLSEEDKSRLHVNSEMRLSDQKASTCEEYMKFHRNEVFERWKK